MYVLFLLSFFALVSILFFFGFNVLLYHPKKIIKYRIANQFTDQGGLIYTTPLLFRIIDPIVQLLSQVILKITPTKYKRFLLHQIIVLNFKYTIQQFLFLKVLITIIASIVFIGIPLLLLGISTLYSILIVGISYFIPDLFLQQLLKKRRREIEAELPHFIDLLSVIIEGGITFDHALQKICQRKKGPLYEELLSYLNEIKMGTYREDALRATAERLQIPEFQSLIRAIIQGEKMGMSISKTIQIQAQQIKQKRRERIRETAMKIPIKIMIPLVLFIFPPIFIVILGPGIIQIYETLF